jgi:acyl-CoA thioester hydrolase
MPAEAAQAQEYVLERSAGAEVIDELSHVSNIAYVGWIQDAAKAHSAAVGWGWEAYFALGAVFVVRRHEIEYLAPVREGERLRIATWIAKWSAVTSERHTRIERQDGTVAVRAKTLWAMVDLATGRPTRIVREIRGAFGVAAEEPG